MPEASPRAGSSSRSGGTCARCSTWTTGRGRWAWRSCGAGSAGWGSTARRKRRRGAGRSSRVCAGDRPAAW